MNLKYVPTRRSYDLPIDNQIVKVNSFYKPGMSIEKVTQKLFPNFSPIVESDSFNVRQEKTNQLKEASNRIVDYKAWLKGDRKSTRLNSSHGYISYAVFCFKKQININRTLPRWQPFNLRHSAKYVVIME